jgi:hypothetical protein
LLALFQEAIQVFRNYFFVSLLFLAGVVRTTLPAAASDARTPEADKQTLTALEKEWLNARDAATLDRILASDFVHPVAPGYLLTKAQNIDWLMKHLRLPAVRNVWSACRSGYTATPAL